MIECNLKGTDKVEQTVLQYVASVENNVLNVLKYAGEKAIAYAKTLDTYKDQTGNLRSSIGYVIYKNGQLALRSAFEQVPAKNNKNNVELNGGEVGLALAQKVAQQETAPFVLVFVAGMNYAAAVERRGYDVIEGASIEASEVAKRLVQGLNNGGMTIDLKDTEA